MVTFLMTFTTPNPVFKVTAFLKSNIVSDSWVSYQYRRSTTKLQKIRHYPSWLSFCDVLKSRVLFFLKWIPVENNEWIQQVTQVNRNRATNSSVCAKIGVLKLRACQQMALSSLCETYTDAVYIEWSNATVQMFTVALWLEITPVRLNCCHSAGVIFIRPFGNSHP